MSTSRRDLRVLEKESLASQPPLFHEYATASDKERSIMDNQLRDLKTNARHHTKSSWHTWRSQLLNDLEGGCLQAARNLKSDDKLLSQVEASFNNVLPGLLAKQSELDNELRELEYRKQHQEQNSGPEVDAARAQLIKAQLEHQEKQITLASLEAELSAKEEALEEARSWKVENLAALKEAERVCEEYRGWSVSEVQELQVRLNELEARCGWSLISAQADAITLGHRGVLQVTLHPRAWKSRNREPDPRSPNAPVKITFVGQDGATCDDQNHDAPIPTVRRFFLQLLRARTLALRQSTTRAGSLLDMLAEGWSLAEGVEKEVRALEAAVGVTQVSIVGDEKIAIETVMLLASLTTKVRVRVEILVEGGVAPADGGDISPLQVDVHVGAKVTYGEKYDESKMAAYLGKEINCNGTVKDKWKRWAYRVDELRGELLKRGKKGVRI
jgi:kinetochore protein Spc7/SPC105